MMEMTRLELLTVFDASLALVNGKRLMPVHSLKIFLW